MLIQENSECCTNLREMTGSLVLFTWVGDESQLCTKLQIQLIRLWLISLLFPLSRDGTLLDGTHQSKPSEASPANRWMPKFLHLIWTWTYPRAGMYGLDQSCLKLYSLETKGHCYHYLYTNLVTSALRDLNLVYNVYCKTSFKDQA